MANSATRRASSGFNRHTPSGWMEKSAAAKVVDATIPRIARSTTGRIGSMRSSANAGYEHFNAAGEFVRTHNIDLLGPFKDRYVRSTDGTRYRLETDPNALHRIAAMDTPPFHEIYEIAFVE
jgi:hypothetical protein